MLRKVLIGFAIAVGGLVGALILMVITMTDTKRSTVGYASASAAVLWVRNNATPCPGSAKPWLLGPARRTVRSVSPIPNYGSIPVGGRIVR